MAKRNVRVIADKDYPETRAQVAIRDEISGSVRLLLLWAPKSGGYVRSRVDDRQICEGFGRLGPTIRWPGAESAESLAKWLASDQGASLMKSRAAFVRFARSED